MSNVYIVNYWVPFPSSEYGGVQIIIASDDNECIKLILDSSEPYYKEKYPDYLDIIKENVRKATTIYLGAENEHPSEIVEEFIT